MTITADAPIAARPADIDAPTLRGEIDRLDAEILALVRRRVEITRRAGLARVGAGLPRVTHGGEMDVLRRFEGALGRDGVSLAMVLIRLGRTGLPKAA